MKVFISYNHRDKEYADIIRQLLEEKGIQVTIDSCDMAVGQRITDFIAESIRKTDATLSIVSRNSLLSTWVAIESMGSLNRKFLPCYTDAQFMNPDFMMLAGQTINGQIEEIQSLKRDAIHVGLGTEHLDEELGRYEHLKANLSTILKKLKNCLCFEISNLQADRDISAILRTLLKQEPAEGTLINWWEGLDREWMEIFRMNGRLDAHPDEAQLKALLGIKAIDCCHKPVDSLAPLSYFNDLETLLCEKTLISSLDPLGSLFQLQFVDCSFTFVTSLDALSGLNKLRKVICLYTRIPSTALDRFRVALPGCKVISEQPTLPL